MPSRGHCRDAVRARRRGRRSPRRDSRWPAAARSAAGSTSTTSATPSFIVTASGCAPPMPPRPAVTVERAGERAAEVTARERGQRFVGALQDALRADVDPAAGRHLSVHRQAAIFEIAERFPRRPLRDEVGVGDEHARRVRVRAKDADRLSRLHEQRLVVAEPAAARRRSRRRPPSCAPRGRCRRRRRDRRGVRRRRDRDCSSASAARLPGAILCTSATCREARGPERAAVVIEESMRRANAKIRN